MGSELDDVKYEVAIANRVLAELGLAAGVHSAHGHASMRVPSEPGTFVVKGRGYAIDALAVMRPEDMVVCDLEGYKLGGPPGSTPCFEVKMHSCIYKARPDVQSVVHVHPRFTVVMTVLGATLVPISQQGSPLVQRPLPVYPHQKTIQSEEEGQEIVAALGNSAVLLLFGHGATTVGKKLDETVMDMAWLEEQAMMNWYAYCAAGPNHPRVPDELIEESRNRPAVADLPNFRDLMPGQGQPRVMGTWQYFADMAARGL